MIQQFILQAGGADKESEILKNKILYSSDELSDSETVYYVSNNGDDSFDGLSMDSAIASIEKVASLPLKNGDKVLFERGSVFRLTEMLWVKAGVQYGAYGKGDKPIFLGSLKNYAVDSYWKKQEENIWFTELKGEQRASMLIFDEDKSFGNWCYTKERMHQDGDFFHDFENGILYFYLSSGNPGNVFEQIEIATTGIAIRASFIDNIVVDNICFKYFAQGAFLFGECNDISITNCVMGWQGGKIFEIRNGEPIRYGNAAEFWYQCKNIMIKNCYVYQIYDAALTFQGYGDGGPIFSNIKFEDNLIEYCSMNIEYWAGMPKDEIPPHIENITYKGNIIRFCGYGFGGIQRIDKEDQALLLGWDRKYTDISNFLIEDNILDCSNGFYIYMFGPKDQEGIILKNNSYYQKAQSANHDFIDIIRWKDTKANNIDDFKRAIAFFDENPKIVEWIK